MSPESASQAVAAEAVPSPRFSGEDAERIGRRYGHLLFLLGAEILSVQLFGPPLDTYMPYFILGRMVLACLLVAILVLRAATAYRLARDLRSRVPALWAAALSPPFLEIPGLLVLGWKVLAGCGWRGFRAALAEISKCLLKAGGLVLVTWLFYVMSDRYSTRIFAFFLLGLALAAGLAWVLYGRWRLVVVLWAAVILVELSPMDVRPKHWTGQPHVARVVWGLPGPELVLASYRGEVWLGGCVYSPHAPKWVITW